MKSIRMKSIRMGKNARTKIIPIESIQMKKSKRMKSIRVEKSIE